MNDESIYTYSQKPLGIVIITFNFWSIDIFLK